MARDRFPPFLFYLISASPSFCSPPPSYTFVDSISPQTASIRSASPRSISPRSPLPRSGSPQSTRFVRHAKEVVRERRGLFARARLDEESLQQYLSPHYRRMPEVFSWISPSARRLHALLAEILEMMLETQISVEIEEGKVKVEEEEAGCLWLDPRLFGVFLGEKKARVDGGGVEAAPEVKECTSRSQEVDIDECTRLQLHASKPIRRGWLISAVNRSTISEDEEEEEGL